MSSGDVENLFEIIPRIGVLRDSRFHAPLIDMLAHKDSRRCEFAAYAMGAMGNREFLGPLKQAFQAVQKSKSSETQNLLIAIIEAIGAIGDDAAVDFFLPILKGPEGVGHVRMLKWIVESLGAIAQQGGRRSLEALGDLTRHRNPELRSMAVSELAVAFWHRPNEIEDALLARICDLMADKNPAVAESAVAAMQSLADVGCHKAEAFFANPGE